MSHPTLRHTLLALAMTALAVALLPSPILLAQNATLVDGSIRLDGQELTTLSDDEFRRQIRWSRMAMVFQGAMHSLNPVIRVGEQVGATW